MKKLFQFIFVLSLATGVFVFVAKVPLQKNFETSPSLTPLSESPGPQLKSAPISKVPTKRKVAAADIYSNNLFEIVEISTPLDKNKPSHELPRGIFKGQKYSEILLDFTKLEKMTDKSIMTLTLPDQKSALSVNINRIQNSPSGPFILTGEVIEGGEGGTKGSFYLSKSGEQVWGSVEFSGARKSYLILNNSEDAQNKIYLIEKNKEEILCSSASETTLYPVQNSLMPPLVMESINTGMDPNSYIRATEGHGITIPANFTNLPLLNSLPGAAKVLYLNFRGHVIANSKWNADFNSVRNAAGQVIGIKNINAVPFNMEGDHNSLSADEISVIEQIYAMVKEDFAPYNVNITTDPVVYNQANPTMRGMALISSTDADYNRTQCNGGAAYVNTFGTQENIARVFYHCLYGDIHYISHVTSHEMSHLLGLRHPQDPQDPVQYYTGHGTGSTSWGNITGFPTVKSVGVHPLSQFANGEYQGAGITDGRPDDELALMARYLPFKVDDHGNTIANARPYGADQSRGMKGIIHNRTDVDMFRIEISAAGPYKMTISPDPTDPNLYLAVRLLGPTGEAIGVYAPNQNRVVAIQGQVQSAQTYFLEIKGTGALNPLNTGFSSYGSLGQYTVNFSTRDSTIATSGAYQYQTYKGRALDVGPTTGLKSGANSNMAFEAYLVRAPLKGRLVGVAVGGMFTNGAFTYQPNPGVIGVDTFTFRLRNTTTQTAELTATITILDVTPSVTVADTYTTTTDTALTMAAPGFLTNDTLTLDKDNASITLVSKVSQGELKDKNGLVIDRVQQVIPNGAFTYTPNGNFTGVDSFSYKVTDLYGVSNVSTVTINVTGRPLPTDSGESYTAQINQELIVPKDLGLLKNAVPGSGSAEDLRVTILSVLPNNGTFTTYPDLQGTTDGAFRFKPNANFVGIVQVSYKVRDKYRASDVVSVATISVVAPDGPNGGADSYVAQAGVPLNISIADLLRNDGSLTFNATNAKAKYAKAPVKGTISNFNVGDILNGTISYTAPHNSSGTDTFAYQAYDGSRPTNLIIVTIDIKGPPQGVADSYTTLVNQKFDVPAPGVVGNDLGQMGKPLTVSISSQPSKGTVQLVSNGSFLFTPPTGFTGTVSFFYTTTEGSLTSAPTEVQISVGAALNAAEASMVQDMRVYIQQNVQIMPSEELSVMEAYFISSMVLRKFIYDRQMTTSLTTYNILNMLFEKRSNNKYFLKAGVI